MPRFTAAYSGFIKRLNEVEILLRTARRTSRKPPSTQNIAFIDALCRSGVVLLSSHIEGYIEDLGEIAIDHIGNRQQPKTKFGGRFKYYLSHDLIRDIKQSNDPKKVTSKIDTLLSRDSHIWGSGINFGSSLSGDIFLADFSNPKHARIRKFFNRFGYKQFNHDLARRLTSNFNACRNMVDQVIDQRNKIAHGDIVATGTPSDLSNMVKLVKLYCRETDSVVGKWFKAQGCPIR